MKEYVSRFDFLLVRDNKIELQTKDGKEICKYAKERAEEELGFKMENELTFKEAKRLLTFMKYHWFKAQEV